MSEAIESVQPKTATVEDHPAPPPVAEPAAPVRYGVDCCGWALAQQPCSCRRAQPQYPAFDCSFLGAAPAKPAPMCEAPGWLGRAHAVDATEYGTCRVCGASAGDRRAARRQAFDDEADVIVVEPGHVGNAERYFIAHIGDLATAAQGGRLAEAPTREAAIEALWTRLEAER